MYEFWSRNVAMQRLYSTLVLKSRIHHFHALNWATPFFKTNNCLVGQAKSLSYFFT